MDLTQKTTYLYYLSLIAVTITIIVITRLKNSRVGMALQAMREDEIASEAMGINLTQVKLTAFALSSAWAGFAGVLFAAKTQFINPASFTFMDSCMILAMVVLGGMGSMAGSVVAAIVLTAAPEALRAFDDYRMIVYSLLLIATMIFKPSGLLGRYDFSMKRIIERCVNGELFASFRRGRGKGAEEA
jgi:branched-chain amino acid transport system permease protein